jgi:hypothetical protein
MYVEYNIKKNPKRSLSQCYFVRLKSHMKWPVAEHACPIKEDSDQRLAPWHGLYRMEQKSVNISHIDCQVNFCATLYNTEQMYNSVLILTSVLIFRQTPSFGEHDDEPRPDPTSR